VGLFLPSWSAEDRVRAYGVFGNMPYYLGHVREDAGLAENVLDLILMRDGLLHEEARLLLDIELPDASAYFSGAVLAIASCKWTDGKMPVAEKTKLEALATHLRPDDPPALHLFSRSGFEQPLLEAAAADPRLNLVGVEQM
jgi:hypothetical protein